MVKVSLKLNHGKSDVLGTRQKAAVPIFIYLFFYFLWIINKKESNGKRDVLGRPESWCADIYFFIF
jgi:hypothetical protein